MKQRNTIGLLSALVSAALLAACGGSGGSDTSTASAGSNGSTGTNTTSTTTTTLASSGTVGVSLTDAPSCGYDAVNVTVTRVRLNQSATASDTDAGWTDITLNPARKINLLDLSNGVLTALGDSQLAPGHYTQIRLLLDPNTGNTLANSVIRSGTTTEVSLSTPSAIQTGIKLVTDFDVTAGQRTDLVLDFDACNSIVTRGNGTVMLKPVVKVLPTALNGIDGFVGAGLAANHVEVSAQQNGQIVASTAPDAVTGEFKMPRLAAGNYDVVITGDGRAVTVITGVPVTSTSGEVVVSTSAAPIVPAVASSAAQSISGTITLNPVSTSVGAYVAAQQTLASGTPVTIRYRAANLDTGDYTLASLPTVAPSVAQYSASLPLTFATQATITPGIGQYAVQASATGYTAQSVSPITITGADQTGVNLTLRP
ncbi:DUF4382 domain-containing protein [Noviherbaspirillum pedocola]|uniref:DUF4382 domain-containing protein n=1 Tax=Noviherbaspirillum pedocola TaxID=2801341 RepID=A0A934SU42_9BURK|nr:DUF4382 domain-containing protein [Noviherbaspirillum pedocola]MBK4735216.1 DUF4382 domain-containing protein [Noviherbaspirillum pedocola]